MPPRRPTSAPGPPSRIHDVITQVLQTLDHPSRRAVDAATWREVAGAMLAAHSAPAAFHDGRLTIHVARPGHLFLLQLKHWELLRALQQRLGADVVRELRFRAGPVEK